MVFNADLEFDRQVNNLAKKNYPSILQISEKDLIDLLSPLKDLLPEKISDPDIEKGTLPFVIVIKSNNGNSEELMSAVEFQNNAGLTKLNPLQPSDFHPIANMSISESQAYLLIGIDRGKATVNVRPEDALEIIKTQHRFPLTIDEGIALITQFPEFLIKNNCFSLLASRTGKDQRVPAIWINANKQANLGWCWDRNPHIWLGSASCEKRVGVKV